MTVEIHHHPWVQAAVTYNHLDGIARFQIQLAFNGKMYIMSVPYIEADQSVDAEELANGLEELAMEIRGPKK